MKTTINFPRLRRWFYAVCLILAFGQPKANAQSIELMAGQRNVFANVQWFKFMDTSHRWSIFARGLGTMDYESNSNFFLGGYFNYTSKIGLGATVIGRMGSSNAGGDIGAHYITARKNIFFSIFATIGIGLPRQPEYSVFSTLIYNPKLTEHLKFYSSLELYSLFMNQGHIYSVQRIRLGLSWRNWQIGPAVDFTQSSNAFDFTYNLGGFIRKAF